MFPTDETGTSIITSLLEENIFGPFRTTGTFSGTTPNRLPVVSVVAMNVDEVTEEVNGRPVYPLF